MADKLDGIALPTITIEELTIRMSLVNTSPFAGREVQNLMINFQN
jgi:GTP-binding protein